MRLHFLLFSFLLAQGVSAQISLEHTYPYANVRRVSIEGKIYYNTIVKQGSTAKCLWFDEQHMPVTNATFIVNPGNGVLTFMEGSATFYDDDPGIETAMGLSANGGLRVILLDDNGSILLDSVNTNVYLSHEVAGQKRLLYGNNVFEIPSFQLLFSFNNVASFNVAFADLETTSPRYGILNSFGNLELYDALDFSPAETYQGGNDVYPCKPNLFLWDKHRLNTDDDFEWSLFAACSPCTARYFSGDEPLLSFQRPGSYLFSQFLPDLFQTVDVPKVLFRSLSLTDTVSSFLYNVDPAALELTLPGRWVPQRSDISDALLAPVALPDTVTTPYPVISLDNSQWASFASLYNSPRTLNGVGEATFDTDAASKEAMIRYALPNTNQFGFFVQRPNGDVLLEVDSMSTGLVSRLSGFDNKLIFSRSSVADTAYNRSLIYSLPSSTPVETKEANKILPGLKAYPNPFAEELRIDLDGWKAQALRLSVFNAYGRLMYEAMPGDEGSTFRINTSSGWAAGVYFIRIQAGRTVRTIPVVKL